MRFSPSPKLVTVLFLVGTVVLLLPLPILLIARSDTAALCIGGIICFLSIWLSFRLWLLVRRLNHKFVSLVPLTEGDWQYVSSVQATRGRAFTMAVIILGWILLAVSAFYALKAAPHIDIANDSFRFLATPVADLTLAAAIAYLLVSVVPLVRDLRSRVLSRGQFRRVQSVGAIETLWLPFSMMLCLSPAYLLVSAVGSSRGGPFLNGLGIAQRLLFSTFLLMAMPLVVLILVGTVVPWCVAWGRRSFLHIGVFLASGILSAFLRKPIFWAGFVLAYVVLLDGIFLNRTGTGSRRLWLIFTGLAIAAFDLAVGALLQWWGLRSASLPFFVIGLSIAAVLNSSLQRWDVA